MSCYVLVFTVTRLILFSNEEHDMPRNLVFVCSDKYHLTGAYRAVVVKPQDFQWEHLSYHAADADLLLSDLDRMQERSLSYTGMSFSLQIIIENYIRIENTWVEKLMRLEKWQYYLLLAAGEKKGLVLRMTLRSSSYATVALRELTKRSSLLTQQRLALTPTKSLLPGSTHSTIIHLGWLSSCECDQYMISEDWASLMMKSPRRCKLYILIKSECGRIMYYRWKGV